MRMFPTLEEKSWNFYDLISAYSGRNTEPYSTRKNWKYQMKLLWSLEVHVLFFFTSNHKLLEE